MGVRLLYTLFIVGALAATVLATLGGLSAGWVAVCAFAAVILSSLLLSWAAEAAETLVSQGLAVALVALLQVMPEFIVEAVIAWRGEVDLMLANATGSNRLLTGVGWPMVYAVAAIAHRARRGRPIGAIVLRPEHAIEVFALVVASLYFLVVIAKGSLQVVDSAVLGGMFAVYFWMLSRLPPEEEKEHLLGPVRALVDLRRFKLPLLLGLFLFGGAVMISVAHSFVDAMKEVALMFGISTFVFVQWVAPFLSEFPEKVTAFYWAMRIEPAPMGLLNLISSTVNQWTALMAMIPIVYSMGQGEVRSVPLDAFHQKELWLSMAMIVYGASTLLKRRFLWTNALILFSLWLTQFLFPTTLPFVGWDTRVVLSWTFAALIPLELFLHRRDIHLVRDLRIIHALLRGRRPTAE